jgi:hypothetical protein
MFEHSFGGDWTEDKLSRLKGYLTQYRRIFTSGKASYFTSWYVDAFAGSGSRSSLPQELALKDLLDDVEDDPDADRYRDGSAKIALSLESPFDRYLFIEKSKARCKELQSLIDNEFPHLRERCLILPGDANSVICSWVAEAFHLGNIDGLSLELAPDYYASPGTMQPVILWDAAFGTRTLQMMFWKFLPPFVLDPKKLKLDTINARRETLLNSSVWRDSFLNRRCLVPVDLFVEWHRVNKREKPIKLFARMLERFALPGFTASPLAH